MPHPEDNPSALLLEELKRHLLLLIDEREHFAAQGGNTFNSQAQRVLDRRIAHVSRAMSELAKSNAIAGLS